MSKIVLITGASAGIGEATAEYFAKHGWNCILIARRLDRLETLATRLSETYQTKHYIRQVDLIDLTQIKEFFKNLPEEWQAINVLVNNAGVLYVPDNLDLVDEQYSTTIDVNMKAVVSITKECLPYLMNTKGHIINLSSICCFSTYEGMMTYSMTKQAIQAFSRSLRYEVLDYNIRVSLLYPGYVDTEFLLTPSSTADIGSIFKSRIRSAYDLLLPIDIASAIFWMVTQPEHVCIDELKITPSTQATKGYIKTVKSIKK